jgi:hypothetical protein
MRFSIFTLFLFACISIRAGDDAQLRRDVFKNCLGTYGRPNWKTNGHADTQKLLSELEEIHANTFHWAIHAYTNEWDEIKMFLPLARKKNIKVWITLMPPSESPPRLKMYSEPFRLDYVRWANEIAKLSLRETNLVAWSIDDFTHNQKVFTPEYLAEMMKAARDVNPRLAFVPCCYYREITPTFVQNYAPLLDAILFPYRDESSGGNLKNPNNVESEIKTLRERLGPEMPIVLDIYASAHSRLGATTPEYVEKAVADGLRTADGMMIYTHRTVETDGAKREAIKRLFRDHAAKR